MIIPQGVMNARGRLNLLHRDHSRTAEGRSRQIARAVFVLRMSADECRGRRASARRALRYVRYTLSHRSADNGPGNCKHRQLGRVLACLAPGDPPAVGPPRRDPPPPCPVLPASPRRDPPCGPVGLALKGAGSSRTHSFVTANSHGRLHLAQGCSRSRSAYACVVRPARAQRFAEPRAPSVGKESPRPLLERISLQSPSRHRPCTHRVLFGTRVTNQGGPITAPSFASADPANRGSRSSGPACTRHLPSAKRLARSRLRNSSTLVLTSTFNAYGASS